MKTVCVLEKGMANEFFVCLLEGFAFIDIILENI